MLSDDASLIETRDSPVGMRGLSERLLEADEVSLGRTGERPFPRHVGVRVTRVLSWAWPRWLAEAPATPQVGPGRALARPGASH